MKTIQIEATRENKELLRAAGVKRIHSGWYTVTFNGVSADNSTVCGARRNRGGVIKF